MSSTPAAGPAGRAFITAGELLFVSSLGFGAYTYLVTFGRQPPAWSWDAARPALVADTGMLVAFALHHSAFARSGLKAWVARTVPAGLERSIYVWCASLLFGLALWLWRDVPGTAWTTSGVWSVPLHATQIAGLALTAVASRRLGVRVLAGSRMPDPNAPLEDTGPYGLVRHPIYLAWLLMVWFSPVMTGSRLLFAVVTTVYLVVAIPIEERSLRQQMGPAYDDYRRRVRWRMIPGGY